MQALNSARDHARGCLSVAACLAMLAASGCARHQTWTIRGCWSIQCVKDGGECCEGDCENLGAPHGKHGRTAHGFPVHAADSGQWPRFHPVPTHDVLTPIPGEDRPNPNELLPVPGTKQSSSPAIQGSAGGSGADETGNRKLENSAATPGARTTKNARPAPADADAPPAEQKRPKHTLETGLHPAIEAEDSPDAEAPPEELTPLEPALEELTPPEGASIPDPRRQRGVLRPASDRQRNVLRIRGPTARP